MFGPDHHIYENAVRAAVRRPDYSSEDAYYHVKRLVAATVQGDQVSIRYLEQIKANEIKRRLMQ